MESPYVFGKDGCEGGAEGGNSAAFFQARNGLALDGVEKDRVVVGHGRFFHHYGRTAFFFLENRDCGAICFSVVIDGEIDFLILLVAVTDSDQRKAAYASVFVGRRVVDQMAIQVAKLQGAEILVEAFGISLVVERRIVDFFAEEGEIVALFIRKDIADVAFFIEETVADEIRCAGRGAFVRNL